MFLYLVQHAEAKREDEDSQRVLTVRGIQDIEKVAAYAERLSIKASRILHSGKTRAFQTARVLSDHLKPEKGSSETDGLAPMDDPDIWFERILKMDEDIMLVGHLPHLGRLVSYILCGDKEKNIIDFRMAGILCLKRSENGIWAVEWMIIPATLL